MPEVKNSFLSSKMNKDLDDRLIPSNEYRDALNISVGKSEDKDVGALEAVFGNEFVAANNPPNNNLICIGQIADNQNNRIFQFWTTYEDPNAKEPTQATFGDMRITVYEVGSTSGLLVTLVEGIFLNFASNSEFRIHGVNVLENLLFWTDNRNQPRKINITKALDNPLHYKTEVQISVAKYAPVSPISVYKKVKVTTTTESSNPTPISTSFSVSTIDAANLSLGMQLVGNYAGIDNYAVITSILGNIVTISYGTTIIPSSSDIYFYGSTMSNESDNLNWPGDPNYLKDKYVRFSYRYKYEDGEYSLMAPFTQIMYIPNQNGYFLSGDENSAYRSTVVSWMENYTNNIVLNIELPDTGNNIASSYKIIGIDILYKESDALAVKVLETTNVSQIAIVANDTNLYHYDYRSQKPYKTLPESQTVRVYDKTPVRARSQEIVGNRVIYGNFVNQNTPPTGINYNLAVIRKSDSFTSWAEYPNHTLKQNRNYQAGIILCDKFGRQSSVILSSNDTITQSNSIIFGGSTIYSPYAVESILGEVNWVKNWRGNTLAMIINSPIVSTKSEGTGEPGLYAIVSGSISGSTDGFQIISPTSVSSNTYNFTLSSGSSEQKNIPNIGNYLRGKYTDYVKVLTITPTPTGIPSGSYTITTDGDISDTYNYTGLTVDVKFSYNINPLGWYSYKIVVRQQQQEYYNVYLPGVLNGYPMYQTTSIGTTVFPTTEVNKTAHAVLINDNINKIPRDLVEVGPDQKQYRSSVELFGRVENTLDTELPYSTNNKQYYPSKKADVASTIATSNELDFLIASDDNTNGTASSNFYQLNTKPTIARISTVNKIGVIASTASSPIPPTIYNTMNPYLSVYETAPVVSVLDLFWESTTAGLISDLNEDVLQGSNITTDFFNFYFNFNEFQKANGTSKEYGQLESPYITSYFEPINNIGEDTGSVTNILMTVEDGTGATRSNDFQLFKETSGPGIGKWVIKIKKQFTFLKNANEKESYIFTFNVIDPTNGNSTIVKTGSLKNSYPIISIPTPGTIVQITEPVIGPIYSCIGTNGAQQTSDPNFNKQELQWSILGSSTPGWGGFYQIDQGSGVISLINTDLVIATTFRLNIRLTDAYNFILDTPGPGSLSVDTYIDFNSPTTANICSDWDSQVNFECVPGEPIWIPYDPETGEGGYYQDVPDVCYNVNYVVGQFDMWKLFLPGEVPDTNATTARVVSYTAQQRTNLIPNTSALPSNGWLYEDVLFETTDTNTIYKFLAAQASGTLSSSTTSTTVIGVGTSFLTDLSPNFLLQTTTGLDIGNIASIESNTSLTLYYNAEVNTTNVNFLENIYNGSWVTRSYGQDITTYYPDNSGTNPMWKLYFYDYLNQFIAQIGNVYYTVIEVPFNIQEANIHPVLTMTLDGIIVTNQRNIPLVASSTYSAILSDRNSTKNDCSSYRLNTLQSWKLTNNGTSVINWKALYPTISGNPAYPSDEIVGDQLAPGEWVGSSNVYGGNKKCIATNSLTYGNGGSAIFSSCV